MTIAICGATETATEWERPRVLWPRKRLKDKKVYVPCCNRNAPIEQTVARFETAFSGYVGDWYFKCAPDAGCSVNKGYLKTRHLRFFD